jgi:hypothetical protein
MRGAAGPAMASRLLVELSAGACLGYGGASVHAVGGGTRRPWTT